VGAAEGEADVLRVVSKRGRARRGSMVVREGKEGDGSRRRSTNSAAFKVRSSDGGLGCFEFRTRSGELKVTILSCASTRELCINRYIDQSLFKNERGSRPSQPVLLNLHPTLTQLLDHSRKDFFDSGDGGTGAFEVVFDLRESSERRRL